MKRGLTLVAAVTLTAGLLAGCGGDDGGSGGGDADGYCDTIEQADKDISSLEGGDLEGLDKAIDAIHEIADDAPDDVAGDWDVLDQAVTDLEAALEEAGVELSDLEGIANGEIPEGFDPAKLATLSEDLSKIGSQEVQDASDNIAKHAKDECGVDLNGS